MTKEVLLLLLLLLQW